MNYSYSNNTIVDENGNVIDSFQFDNGRKATNTVYSDRLFQWDYKKHNALCDKHFGNQGQYWGGRSSERIEAFLRDYTSEPKLVLCRIEQHENKATGYPLWRFDYLIEE